MADRFPEAERVLLYVPPHLLREKYLYSALLYPFWGIEKRTSMPFVETTFAQVGFDTRYYALTEDPARADYVLMPYSYWFLKKHDPALIGAYVREARKHGKPILIDAVSDVMKKIDIEGSVILRYAYYRSRMRENDIVMPVYTADLLALYGEGRLSVRKKKERPRVGFAGWASLPFSRYPKTRLKDLPLFLLGLLTSKFDLYRKGVLLREKALKKLAASPAIDANFIFRSSFSANKKTAEKDPGALRKEFVENMLDSDYVLCVRGDANQSGRFFEALSLGRILVFVDTDMALPIPDIVRYEDFCVHVDYRDIDRIDEIVSDFHRNLSPERFEDMQRKARDAYERYLRLDSYTPFLMRTLKELAKKARP